MDVLLGGSALGPGLFEQAMEACPQALSIVDMQLADQPLVYVNRAFELLTGYARAEVLGRNCRFLRGAAVDPGSARRIRAALQQGERMMVTVCNARKDGSEFLNELFLEPIVGASGAVTHFVGLQNDVSERDRRQGEAHAATQLRESQALPGRLALDDRIEQSLARAQAMGTRFALVMIDLSGPSQAFEADSPLARSQLYELARVIGEAVPHAGSSLSRLHGRRLALLLDPAPALAQLAELARRVLDAVNRQLASQANGATGHLGIAIGPVDGSSAQELTVAAGRALDRARLQSRAGEFSFFANAQDACLLPLRQMENDLAEAIAAQQFSLVFQPIVALETTAIVGFEALIRWIHPVRGPVPPAAFMPVAESTGMIIPISDWVIDTALAQLAVFDRLGGPPQRMFINISASQLAQPGFVDALRQRMLHHGIKAGRVELEITERTVTDHSAPTLQALRALRQLGVSLAIDDFGTGYCNLHNLTQLPIDSLKIDMSFTQAVTQSNAAASVSRMICELSRTLDLQVIVEGIETEGQLNHFRALACPYGQGFLFSQPLAPEAAIALLQCGKPLFGAAPVVSAPQLLLLDDDQNILSALRRLLRREGYQVHTTTSPQEAFEILATHPVGVVLSDQRMPQMSGTDFLRQVKKLHPLTVRMVLSGYSEPNTVQAAVNEGAIWKFLCKPWEDDALREQIRLAFLEHAALRDTARQQADAALVRAQLESEVSQRDQRLALKTLAIESARDALLLLPIPVLGIDPSHMVVMSNLEADRLFGGGASLMGEFMAALFPPAVEQALAATEPVSLQLAGRPFRLHVQALGGASAPNGHLLSLVPGSDE